MRALKDGLVPPGVGVQPERCHEVRPASSFALLLRVSVLVTCWWTAAICVTLVIKGTIKPGGAVLGGAGFPYPFALSGLTNSATGLLALGLSCIARPHAAPLPPLGWGDIVKLAALGGVQGIEIGCTNKALEYISVATRTVVASGGVLFTMLAAWCVGLERFGGARLAAGLLLAAGTVLQGLDQQQQQLQQQQQPFQHQLPPHQLAQQQQQQPYLQQPQFLQHQQQPLHGVPLSQMPRRW
mmetsp:Transcript_25685/g.81518  ORF Transcript_25685/g.81518 Transcript_25685/m.81518 type:complete len:240 (+) Transcript_25685:117-836(+)